MFRYNLYRERVINIDGVVEMKWFNKHQIRSSSSSFVASDSDIEHKCRPFFLGLVLVFARLKIFEVLD